MIEPGKIVFNCDGALDFTEYVCIELLDEAREGFIEIHPSHFMRETYIPHLGFFQKLNMQSIFNRVPHISDLNPDLPHRWQRIWYRCYHHFQHSHEGFNSKGKDTPLTLKEAMDMIKDKKLDLHQTLMVVNKRRKLNEVKENTVA